MIASMKPDKAVGAQVELNPKLLAFMIGESEAVITKAIEFLCEVDPKSRTPDEGGRRLVKIGTYDYWVVNGKKYLEIRDEESRRESNRMAKRAERARKIKKGSGSAREKLYAKAHGDGDNEAADRMAEDKVEYVVMGAELE